MTLPVRDLTARGRIDGRVLRLDELSLRQGRSDYRLSGTIADPLALNEGGDGAPGDADGPALHVRPLRIQPRIADDIGLALPGYVIPL